jgi:uncharacterized membrane protein
LSKEIQRFAESKSMTIREGAMRKLMAVGAVAVVLATAPVAPAAADQITTKTLAYTFVLALAGTAAGAMLVPYAAPMAAPYVAGAYATTATAVNSAITGLGGLLLTEPRMTGAVLGMGAGLMSGLYYFQE